MGIGDKMHKVCERVAFITVKDHTEDFRSFSSFRLINPTKTELSVISHVIIQNFCGMLRVARQVNQWKSLGNVLSGSRKLIKKNYLIFVKHDICDLYPSITENNLIEALKYAKHFVSLQPNNMVVIFHWRTSVLFHCGEAWVKKIS